MFYNTRTLRTEESLESLLDEVKEIKWDIIGLWETKREGEGITELKGGTWLYNYGKTEDNTSAKGIGFLIHPKYLLSHRTNMNFVETSSYMPQHSLFTITYMTDFPMMTQHS